MAADGAKSKESTLGPLQQRVLEFVWANQGCTVRACLDSLNTEGDKTYAYTTIQTVFDTLHRKKLVSRRHKKGTYHYAARETRAGLLGTRLKELLSRFGGEPQPVASSLVDSLQETDPEQLEALIEELKKRGHIDG